MASCGSGCGGPTRRVGYSPPTYRGTTEERIPGMRTVTTLPVTEMTVGPRYNSTTRQGNWDPSRQPILTIVIHTMDGTVESANARFNDSSSNVSAHYGVGLDGTIYHWVDETNS